MSSFTWFPAIERLDLLAATVSLALNDWAESNPQVYTDVLVSPVDPDQADTDVLTEAYGLDPALSGNCVLVAGRREGTERLAAAVVRATTRADVNSTIKKLLDVRKASFLATDRAVADSGMEYGGITPLGLPENYRVLLDTRVTEGDVLIGSGIRGSKVILPGALLANWPRAEVVEGLAREVTPG